MTAQPAINSIVHARPAPLQVLIIGGGIGGLTLAQGLKKSGVSVAVYERDRTTTDRVATAFTSIPPAAWRYTNACRRNCSRLSHAPPASTRTGCVSSLNACRCCCRSTT